MSLVKSEIKCATIHEMGTLAEDSMEQAKKDFHLAQGANAGLVQAVKKIEVLGKNVDQDLDEGKLEVTSPLEVATIVKRYLQRVVAVIRSDSMSYEQRMFMAQGAEKALKNYVGATKKLFDLESHRIETLKRAVEEDVEENASMVLHAQRGNGKHPGMSVKQRRLIEEHRSLTGETSSKPKKMKVRRITGNAKDS